MNDYLAGEQVRVIDVTTDADVVHVHLERDLDLALSPPGWASRATIVADATSQLRRG